MSTKHCDSEECAVEREEKPNIDGDRLNLCLLLILYVIQGFPIGFALATSNILQSKKSVTYEDQVSLNDTFIFGCKVIRCSPLDC